MRQTVVQFKCDSCGKDIDEGKEATVRAVPADKRKQPKQADYCDDCFKSLPGTQVKRRGRAAAQ